MKDQNFFQINSGGDRNYGYLIICGVSGQAVLIDPSPDPLPCDQKLTELNLTPRYLINTHSHFDHTDGNSFFKKKYNVKLVCHKNSSLSDLTVSDNQTLECGGLTIRFLYTPGHTDDSLCVLIDGELFTGDTLFVGKVGGTGSQQGAITEFDSLKKLMALNPETRIWPGHNYGTAPTSTIKKELESNPFILRLDDFEKFNWLKLNWADYKLEHGIK